MSSMSKAAKTIFLFSLYMVVLGASLIVIPNTILSLLGFPETNEGFIRILGALVLILGFYYMHAARKELREFFRATVYGRLAVLGFFVLFVILGFSKPILILFGVVDAIGATWTGLVMRSESAEESRTS